MPHQTALVIASGAIAAAAAAQIDRPELQSLSPHAQVIPTRIARAAWDGSMLVRAGEWADHRADAPRADVVRIFDCFGDSDSDGKPDDRCCGLGSSRWYWGTSYCNGFVTNDCQFHHQTLSSAGAQRIDLAWYWTCNGVPGELESCQIAVVFDTSDQGFEHVCEPEDFSLSGWILDFGELECVPRGYYYANVDLGTQGTWPLPRDSEGSYMLRFLTDDATRPATCAQPMLWTAGISDCPNPNIPGTQGYRQADDWRMRNDRHDFPGECEDYNYGPCPQPLGAMLQAWGTHGSVCPLDSPTEVETDAPSSAEEIQRALEATIQGEFAWIGDSFDPDWTAARTIRLAATAQRTLVIPIPEQPGGEPLLGYLAYTVRDGECRVDFNADGAVDSRDVLAYLNAWAARDPGADMNGDGVIDTRDFLAFLNLWAAGCPVMGDQEHAFVFDLEYAHQGLLEYIVGPSCSFSFPVAADGPDILHDPSAYEVFFFYQPHYGYTCFGNWRPTYTCIIETPGGWGRGLAAPCADCLAEPTGAHCADCIVGMLADATRCWFNCAEGQ